MTSSDPLLWSQPPKDLNLRNDEVHVWRTTLDLAPTRIESLYAVLTADEQARAARFFFQKDRGHFIAARGILRIILARYLHQEPQQIRFKYNYYGKPCLSPESESEPLHFNLSHSDGLALYAVTYGRRVGVDLERVRPALADEQIAERFFSSREVAKLRSLPSHLQAEAFFNCWTRKEAYIKARGEGFSIPLDSFDVSLTPEEPATPLHVERNLNETRRWSLKELLLTPKYVAALAVEGHNWQLRVFGASF